MGVVSNALAKMGFSMTLPQSQPTKSGLFGDSILPSPMMTAPSNKPIQGEQNMSEYTDKLLKQYGTNEGNNVKYDIWADGQGTQKIMAPETTTASDIDNLTKAGFKNMGTQTDNAFNMETMLDRWNTEPKKLANDSASDGSMLDKAWDNIGGIGTALSGAASIYDAFNKKKYQDKIVKMEEQRIAKANSRMDKAQKAFESVWS